MWLVQDIGARSATLDRRSSGQGETRAVEVIADGTRIASAANLTAWSTDRIQLELCDACGVVGCAPGGWLAPRRAGELVVLAPPFEAMREAGDESTYAPPAFARRGGRGVPVMSKTVYERLRDLVTGLPAPTALPLLTGEEGTRLVQWEAPADILGPPGRPVALRTGMFVAASQATPEHWSAEIARLIEQTRRAPFVIIEATREQPVCLYLDLSCFTEWPAVVRAGGRLAWYLPPGLVLSPAPAAW